MSCTSSKPGSKTYTNAFANRSKAFIRTKQYPYCLDDIRLALELKYPTRLLYKLYVRSGNAERKLGRGDLAKTYYSVFKIYRQTTITE